jgi:lipopolysaccharide kinase (Kdo/WaaP) family protein
VRALAERAYFSACLTFGRLLRSATYSKTRIVHDGGEVRVRKHRVFYAPFLVWLGGLLVRLLDTGVRILPQSEWEEREREVYAKLHGARIEVDAELVLLHLGGTTLATLLEESTLGDSARKRAIELAVAALGDFHARGFTHGDAMAENVMVDLEAGLARWFDFETVHDPSRPQDWRRADDVRALLATCLVRTSEATFAETLQLILKVYGDEGVTRLLSPSFTVFRRPLTFHLGQAGLSFEAFRRIAALLRDPRG